MCACVAECGLKDKTAEEIFSWVLELEKPIEVHNNCLGVRGSSGSQAANSRTLSEVFHIVEFIPMQSTMPLVQ